MIMPQSSHFHSSGRNANTPYLKRELIFRDKAGNSLYNEWLVNGKIVISAYNRDGELVVESDTVSLVNSAKKAGAFGTKKVKKVRAGGQTTSWHAWNETNWGKI
tara:strand:- start:97 stop:408 length:312 start_codon:yes stop_codon:yes gene_type:complete